MSRRRPEEKVDTDPKEIVFGGEGYAHAILSGKYSTLRLDNKYYASLKPGDEVVAVCNPTRISLVILAAEKEPLYLQDRVILATNGFLCWEQAAARLNEIYGKEVGPGDETVNILYLPRDVFEALPPKQRALCLVHSAIRLVRDKRTREIFLPSIYFTFAYEYERSGTLLSWLDFCVFTGIASLAQRDHLIRLIKTDQYIGEDKATQLLSEPQRMWDVFAAKGYSVYDRLVLLRPVRRDGVVHPELVG